MGSEKPGRPDGFTLTQTFFGGGRGRGLVGSAVGAFSASVHLVCTLVWGGGTCRPRGMGCDPSCRELPPTPLEL